MKNRIHFLLILIVTLLNACSMNSSFDCPNRAGVMCQSVDQINGMVDSGQIHGRTQSAADYTSTSTSEFQPYVLSSGFYPGAPLRYGETVQRIWIAPFEDTEKNYHQDSYMYAIIKDGHWIGAPVKVPSES